MNYERHEVVDRRLETGHGLIMLSAYCSTGVAQPRLTSNKGVTARQSSHGPNSDPDEMDGRSASSEEKKRNRSHIGVSPTGGHTNTGARARRRAAASVPTDSSAQQKLGIW